MAARYWVGGGSTSNWNATGPTNWASTSGGANNVAIPTVADDVIFDGAGALGNTANTVGASQSTLSLTFTAGYTNTVTINSNVNLTIAGAFTDNTAHSWVALGTAKIIISATSTITSGGKTFPGNVEFSGTSTKTLVGDWTLGGALSFNGATTFNKTTNEVLNCVGLSGGQTCSGTITINLTGGSVTTFSNLSFSELKFSGNVTIPGTLFFSTGTLTYVSGTVTTTGSTLSIGASTTLNTNGITWNNVTITASTTTLTLNSLLSVSGIFTISASTTASFAGTGGFTVGTFTISSIDARTFTFNDAATFTITTAFNCALSRAGAIVTIISDDATNKVPFILSPGATCNVLASFLRVNAAGRTIYTFNGTVSNCTNIIAMTDPTLLGLGGGNATFG